MFDGELVLYRSFFTFVILWWVSRWLFALLPPDFSNLTHEKKAFVVTGAASGIGRATVLKLASLNNVEVFACDQNEKMLKELQRIDKVHTFAMDVTSPSDCEDLKGKGVIPLVVI
jgi:hypothetical protein